MKNTYRDEFCANFTEEYVGQEVKACGWVDTIRDHGGLIFVDLRDSTGVIQLVSNDEEIFDNLTRESTIGIVGKLRKREEIDYNPNLKTGTIEVLVEKLEVFSKANNVLPFEVKSSIEVGEDLRLKHRYLDLRNKKMHDTLILRSKILAFIRNKMIELGFDEIQTPILSASSPEGARDFVVPSRKFHGKFYALPQAPQVYKQLLMVSGFDKYFQIAPCFRDEDCRADRTLEFYQLDFEMSFATEDDVIDVGEKVFYSIFTEFSDRKVNKPPFRRIPYKEAMLKYGTDKPDLRNPLEIIDLSEIFKESEFKPFKGINVRGIKVEDIGEKPNSWFNELVDYASSIDMPGLGYIVVKDDMTFKGPIDKFLTDKNRKDLIEKADLKKNSVLFFIADKDINVVSLNAGLIRTKLGEKLDLIDKNRFEFCVVNDFPMFEYNEEEGKYEFGHNPFSMPQGGEKSLTKDNIENINAYQYDIVCNGNEMASGAVRNHNIEIMKKSFALVGYDEDFIKQKFSSLYTAFKYGAPPHAGMAPGIDRIIMLLTDEPNLREVQAFPPNVSGADNLMGSPSELTENQLRELHIKIR